MKKNSEIYQGLQLSILHFLMDLVQDTPEINFHVWGPISSTKEEKMRRQNHLKPTQPWSLSNIKSWENVLEGEFGPPHKTSP
jgi:hypothetical protein